jgi:hypothetical protein
MYTKNHTHFDIAVYFIIPFFGFYTVKFGFSPIYITFIFAVFFLTIGSIYKINSWTADFSTILSITSISYAIVLHQSIWNYSDKIPSAWINYIFSLFYFLTTILILKNSNRSVVVKASYYAIALSIVLLSIELLVRVLNPSTAEEIGHYDREDIFWYIYKSNSFMYPDSNSIGLFSSCLFIFTLLFSRHYYRRANVFLLPIFILILGSISRAAIASAIIVYIYQLINIRIFRLLYLITLAMCSGFVIIYINISDESVLSRFWIADLVLQHLIDASILPLMFGVGPGNAEKILNVGTHLLPFTLIVEIGFIGTILFIMLWYGIYIQSGRTTGELFVVFILNGFFFTTFAIPWFYAMTAILIFLNKEFDFDKVTVSLDSRSSI